MLGDRAPWQGALHKQAAVCLCVLGDRAPWQGALHKHAAVCLCVLGDRAPWKGALRVCACCCVCADPDWVKAKNAAPALRHKHNASVWLTCVQCCYPAMTCVP